MKELMKKAHQMTREIVEKYNDVDYRVQFGLCLSYLANKGGDKMVELNGTPKQVAWAEDIRKKALENLNNEDSFDNITLVCENLMGYEYSLDEEENVEEAVEEVRKLVAEGLGNIDRAKFFIDCQNSLKLDYYGLKIIMKRFLKITAEDLEEIFFK